LRIDVTVTRSVINPHQNGTAVLVGNEKAWGLKVWLGDDGKTAHWPSAIDDSIREHVLKIDIGSSNGIDALFPPRDEKTAEAVRGDEPAALFLDDSG
jgi:hypothetical protein